MKHYPARRYHRLSGLETCLEHAHREEARPSAWLLLLIGAAAFAFGFGLLVVAWRIRA